MADKNPLGVHALVWTGTWDPPAVQAAAQATAAAGYDILEVPLLDPSEVDAEMTRAALADAGLAGTCSLGLDMATDISSTDTTVVAAGERLLRSAIDVSARIGSTYVGGPIYSAMAKYTTQPTAAGRANSIRVLRDLAAEASRSDIVLGLEPVNRYESNLLNTIDQTLDLIDEIGADNVVVHADTYHQNIEERDTAAALARAARAGRLGYVHVGESHRGYLGTGSIDWDPFFAALVETGYDGPVVFESFSSTVVSDRFAGALAIWRNLWTDSMDLATSARAFIVEHMDRAAQESR